MILQFLNFLVGALALYCAYSVLFRQKFNTYGPLTIVRFLVSLFVTLFPLQLAILLLLWVAWMLFSPNETSVLTWGSIVLGTVAAFGLVWFLFGQLRLRRTIEETLDAASIDRLGANAPAVRLWPALLPIRARRKRVERLKNLSYGNAGLRNLLDIYRPRDWDKRTQPLPVLLQLHGSGWMYASKDRQSQPLINLFADQGWLVVAINYRLSPKDKFPAHLIDTKLAIAWIRKNIARYGGDPHFIAITGASAGGHLATIAALTPDHDHGVNELIGQDLSVQAAVPLYGRYDFLDRDESGRANEAFIELVQEHIMPGGIREFPEIWDLASPVTQVRSDAPPFFIVHMVSDSMIPVEVVRPFVSKLKNESKQVVAYAELPTMQHGFDLAQSPATEFTIHGVYRFLMHQLN